MRPVTIYEKAAGDSTLIIMEGHAAGGVILAQSLSSYVGRPVVDKTGFTGRFEVHLEFTLSGTSLADVNGPSIFEALEQQLGLKLIADRAPVEYLILDHVEKLSGSEQ